MKGLLKKTLAAGLSLLFCIGAVACTGGGKSEPGENGYLHISAVRLGYGTDWLYALEEVFEEKYKINIDISTVVGSSGQAALDTEIESRASDTDLFFNKRGYFAEDVYKGSISAGGQTYDCLYADLSDVWVAAADEGSDKTIADKIDPLYGEAYNIEGKYYALPWAGGVYGIVRNVDVWEGLGLTDADVPCTTDELFALCDRIKDDLAADGGKACFIYSLGEEYYTGWSPIFFGQYEGVEAAKQFMEGKDPDGNVTQYIYTYEGLERAMEVMEQLLKPANGYQYSRSSSIDFTQMQGLFLRGEALFCVNGSWLENEMKANMSDAEVDMIKTPVVSSLVERLSFGDTLDAAAADEKLAELVRYVDAVAAGEQPAVPSGVNEEDIRIVTEARHYAYMAGGVDHQAYVPSYSKHIREAKEFLKFMYSDEGLQIYYETLNGAMLPAEPTVGYDDAGMEFTGFRKSVNAAQEEGFLYDREAKARFFVLPSVSACFENGIDPVLALSEGKTASDVISANNADIEKKWPSIQAMLGLRG